MKNKTIHLELNRFSDNSLSLLSSFTTQARLENWSEREIDEVCDEASSGDYPYVKITLKKHCKDEED